MAGCATARSSPAQIATLRKNPAFPADVKLPAGFLKHSDEQTVLALATVSQALIALNRPTASYRDWGVLAAANLFGRASIYKGLCDFRREGAWGISPHLVPHLSLHAVSGTISQALGLHGPNFGVGGGPKGVAGAFLSAATLLSENHLPGLWVVMTAHNPESLPTATEQPTSESATCLAVAFALKPIKDADSATSLSVSGGDAPRGWAEFDLAEFMHALQSQKPTGEWALPGGGWVNLRIV
jgi:hypothetical protein